MSHRGSSSSSSTGKKREDESDDESSSPLFGGLHSEPSSSTATPETKTAPLTGSVRSRTQEMTDAGTYEAKASAVMKLLNGDYYMPNDMGEAETKNADYHWLFPSEHFNAKTPDTYEEGKTPLTALELFASLNYADLKSKGVSQSLAAKITSWRMLAVKEGLVRPGDTPSITRTKYVEVSYKTASATQTADLKEYYDIIDAMPARIKDNIGASFANVVCTIAFVFRVRGHHYLDDLQAVYDRIWGKLRGMPDGMVNSADWKTIATIGLHAITPLRLDNFWAKMVRLGQVGNPLAIRFNAPAAGTAAWYAIMAGVSNLKALIPEHSHRFDDQIHLVTQAVQWFETHRWDGSINRRLYNAGEFKTPLSKVSELAAAVRGSVEPDDLQSELKNAASMNKVISNAPLVRVMFRSYAEGLINATNQADVRAKIGSKMFDFVGFQEIGDHKASNPE